MNVVCFIGCQDASRTVDCNTVLGWQIIVCARAGMLFRVGLYVHPFLCFFCITAS